MNFSREKVLDVKKTRVDLFELHVFQDKQKYLIKLIFWIFSWVGGIYVLNDKSDGVGSAYLLFSLSLLLDFAPLVTNKNSGFVIRLIHVILFFIVFGVFFLSAIILFTGVYKTIIHRIMFILTIIIMVFVFIDFFILSCSQGKNNSHQINDGSNHNNYEAEITEFNKCLYNGNLGSIRSEKNV